MLTASDLASMRATIGDSLVDTAIIQTSQRVSDGRGGGTTSWVNAGTVDCRVAPVASSGDGERVQGGRVHPDTEYIFTFPFDTEIDDDARINYADGLYSVTSLRSPRSWELSRRIEAKGIN